MPQSISAPLDEDSALALRREIYGKGRAERDDLVRLLDMTAAAGAAASPEFAALLAEVATDVIVRDVDPPKYVRQADADWLAARLRERGGADCQAEFKMLVEVIRHAVSLPAPLAEFAVAEIERGVMRAGRVSKEGVEALRVAVYAADESGALHVEREQAEALFSIADATKGADNDPGFDDLFARAIGNYLMGVAFRWTTSAKQAREIDHWLDRPAPSFDEFLGAMFDRDAPEDGTLRDRLMSVSDRAEARDRAQNEADARAMAGAAPVEAVEADWLLDRLYRDGEISSAEKRLLRFLKEESPSLAPALAALIEKQAA